MKITVADHLAGLTQVIGTNVNTSNSPKLGLMSFFPTKVYSKKTISVQVKRKGSLIATDIKRCSGSNNNTFGAEALRTFLPPFFNESFDFTQCEDYDVSIGRGIAPIEAQATALAASGLEKALILKEKIDRAKEKMRAEVLQTGIVKLKSGDHLDFKRLAESFLTLSGASTWDKDTAKIMANLEAAGDFIQSKGRSASNVLNVIFGSDAIRWLFSNKEFLEKANYRRIDNMSIHMPKYSGFTGIVSHGQFSAGPYVINVLAYTDTYEEYDKDTGITTELPYVDPKNVIVVSDDFYGETAHATIPAVFVDDSTGTQFVGPRVGEFVSCNYVDQRDMAWWFEIASAPIPVPVTIDRIFTIKVA